LKESEEFLAKHSHQAQKKKLEEFESNLIQMEQRLDIKERQLEQLQEKEKQL
jgi:hypothetical protein